MYLLFTHVYEGGRERGRPGGRKGRKEERRKESLRKVVAMAVGYQAIFRLYHFLLFLSISVKTKHVSF